MCAEIIQDVDMIDKKFDMLTVIAFVGNKPTRGRKRKDENGNVIAEDPKGSNKTWLCKCDCGKEVEVTDRKLKDQTRKTVLSCGCTRKRREYLPLTDWDLLYRHVKSEVLQYPPEANIPSHMMLLLVGLKRGQKTADYRKEALADYSDRVVLNTFIACKDKIDWVIKNKKFSSDYHKLSYVCAIVAKHLNQVLEAMKAHERAMQDRALSAVPIETYEEQMERYVRAHSSDSKYKEKTGVFADAF